MSWFGAFLFYYLWHAEKHAFHWEIWKNSFYWSLFVNCWLCAFTVWYFLFTACNRSPKPNVVVSAPSLDDYKFISRGLTKAIKWDFHTKLSQAKIQETFSALSLNTRVMSSYSWRSENKTYTGQKHKYNLPNHIVLCSQNGF